MYQLKTHKCQITLRQQGYRNEGLSFLVHYSKAANLRARISIGIRWVIFMISISFKIPDLTPVFYAPEGFQDFEPALRATAIALYSQEIGINELHLYRIASIHFELAGGCTW
jgi:hypothetical protein